MLVGCFSASGVLVGSGVSLAIISSIGGSVRVAVGRGVLDRAGVLDGVRVGVRLAKRVGVRLGVRVADVCGVSVALGVLVAERVSVAVGCGVSAKPGVAVGASVAVLVDVGWGVLVGGINVAVGGTVGDAVLVGARVGLGGSVGVALDTLVTTVGLASAPFRVAVATGCVSTATTVLSLSSTFTSGVPTRGVLSGSGFSPPASRIVSPIIRTETAGRVARRSSAL